MKKILYLIFICVLFSGFNLAKNQSALMKGRGSGGVAPGTTLAGDETEYTTETTFTDPDKIYRVQYVAVDTAPVAAGFWRTASDSSDSILLIYDSSDNLLAQSDTLTTHPDGWAEYAFSGANQITITSGVTYGLAIFAESYIDYYDGNSEHIATDSATWDTPADPFSNEGSTVNVGPWGLYITA